MGRSDLSDVSTSIRISPQTNSNAQQKYLLLLLIILLIRWYKQVNENVTPSHLQTVLFKKVNIFRRTNLLFYY